MKKMDNKGQLIVVSGPSGAGKDTIVKEVLKTNKSAWESISCTSRSPRPGEVDGRDYYFLSREEFKFMKILVKHIILYQEKNLNKELKKKNF